MFDNRVFAKYGTGSRMIALREYLAGNSICVLFPAGDSKGTVSGKREKEVKGKTRRADNEKIK